MIISKTAKNEGDMEDKVKIELDSILEYLKHNEYDLKEIPKYFQIESFFLSSTSKELYFLKSLLLNFHNNPNFLYFLEYKIRNLSSLFEISNETYQLEQISDILFAQVRSRIIDIQENFSGYYLPKLLSVLKLFTKTFNKLFPNKKKKFRGNLALWMNDGVRKMCQSSSLNEKYIIDTALFLQSHVDIYFCKAISRKYSSVLINAHLKQIKNVSLSHIYDICRLFNCVETKLLLMIFSKHILPKLKIRIKKWVGNSNKLENNQKINSFVLHSHSCKEIIEILFEPLQIIEKIEEIVHVDSFSDMFVKNVLLNEIKFYVNSLKYQSNKNGNLLYLNNIQEVNRQIRSSFKKKKSKKQVAIFLENVNIIRNKLALLTAKDVHKCTKSYLFSDYDQFIEKINCKLYFLSERLYKKIFHLVLKHLFNLFVKQILKEILKEIFRTREKSFDDCKQKLSEKKIIVDGISKIFYCEGNGVSKEYIKKQTQKLSIIFGLVNNRNETEIMELIQLEKEKTVMSRKKKKKPKKA